MTDSIRIDIGPAKYSPTSGAAGWRNPKFPCNGGPINGLYRDPEHQVARDLIKAGFPASMTLLFYRDGKPIWEPREIGEWAKYSAYELDKGVVIREFKEFEIE